MNLPTQAERIEREQTLERHIAQRTGGRVRRLRAEATEARVVVHGEAPSYYIKQLAVAAIREVLPTTPVEVDIGVVAGNPSWPQGRECPQGRGQRI